MNKDTLLEKLIYIISLVIGLVVVAILAFGPKFIICSAIMWLISFVTKTEFNLLATLILLLAWILIEHFIEKGTSL